MEHRAYHWIRDHIDRGLNTVSHVPGDLTHYRIVIQQKLFFF